MKDFLTFYVKRILPWMLAGLLCGCLYWFWELRYNECLRLQPDAAWWYCIGR